MQLTIMFLVVIVVALVIFFFTVVHFRHQRILNELKARYQNVKKVNQLHWRRYETYQADIERLRANFNQRTREMAKLNIEMERERKEIKDLIEILNEEIKQKDRSMDQDLIRIIDRRKDIVKKQWQIFNGKKAVYIAKLKQAKQGQVAVDGLNVKKDKEFISFNETKLKIERLKKDYQILARRSVFSFGRKN